MLGQADKSEHPHLLQLQLALPLPHDVALFQQLLLGLLKLFLPLEGRQMTGLSQKPQRPHGAEGEASCHQVALHTAPRLPLQAQDVWGQLPEEAGLLGLLQLPLAQEHVSPGFPRQQSHPSPSPRHVGSAHLSSTTGPWYLPILTQPGMLRLLSWHPGLCPEARSTPSSYHSLFTSPMPVFCLCLHFRIHLPKQNRTTSALVTRAAQALQGLGSHSWLALQDPDDTDLLV